jgi:spermidine synthase
VKHWTKLGEAPIPGSDGHLELFRGKDDFFIRTSGGIELMSSRKHGSEDALGAFTCRAAARRDDARVLIGGLGMGFTLAAALAEVGAGAEVMVAELVPGVIEWNRGPLGDRAGRPLDDPRTRVYQGDVADLLRDGKLRWDAIALDVDNGPEGLTQDDNQWLYSAAGLAAIHRALSPAGTLAVWSAGPDPLFLIRLKKAGFHASPRNVRARPGKGSRHVIFLATRTPEV